MAQVNSMWITEKHCSGHQENLKPWQLVIKKFAEKEQSSEEAALWAKNGENEFKRKLGLSHSASFY